jgi:beta-ureidopropionase / N-carbamoyl-L-amino-acid hydrolase
MAVSVAAHVDGGRLWRRLMDLARFGATEKGGVHRLALSDEEIAARAELVRWGLAIGLEPATDPAANLFLRLRGREPDLPPLLVGSHIDSQPTGGKFDGAYGVIAALECAEAILGAGQRPRRSLEVVAWMNEEGSRFAPGMMGSAVFAGVRRMADIEPVRDRAGMSVRDALERVRAAEPDLPLRPLSFPAAGFLEAHIEQGVTLERTGMTIGVVTSIQGKRTFRVTVEGAESHAGTSRRAERRDALASAVDVVKALQAAIWDEADTVRFTIGQFTVSPNAPSVVPGRVEFSIDLRHDEATTVRALGDIIPEVCARARGPCEVSVRELLSDEPIAFPKTLRDRLAAAAGRLGFTHCELPSPAGHDSRYLSRHCPTAMLFIPCKDGISHNEAESISPADAEAGVRVLTEVAFELADADAVPGSTGGMTRL